MWKISIIALFFFLVVSVYLERNTVESRRYETVITWITRPWKCYQFRGYKRERSLTVSGCKDYCIKDDKCKMVQFLEPWCYFKDDQSYKTYGCSVISLLFLKDIKKKLIPTTKNIAPRRGKHVENCLEFESYSDYKAKDEAECKLKCYLDEECLVVEFRADLLLCKLSKQRRFKKEKRCKNSGEIFVKVDPNEKGQDGKVSSEISDNSGHDRSHISSHLIIAALVASILRNLFH